jgi:DDE superfamily endonuclease
MACWNALFDQARSLGLSALTCLGRHTLSGLLCTAGQQFRDWSAAYRLFERERLDPQALWRVPLNGVLETLPPASPLVALLDDTLIRKRGHRIAGTYWRRDPLGLHFADNFICASRFLQVSLALPEHPTASASSARAIPVDLRLRRANLRAAPIPSKTGVHSWQLPPSAAAGPNASLICGTPLISSRAAARARC